MKDLYYTKNYQMLLKEIKDTNKWNGFLNFLFGLFSVSI